MIPLRSPLDGRKYQNSRHLLSKWIKGKNLFRVRKQLHSRSRTLNCAQLFSSNAFVIEAFTKLQDYFSFRTSQLILQSDNIAIRTTRKRQVVFLVRSLSQFPFLYDLCVSDFSCQSLKTFLVPISRLSRCQSPNNNRHTIRENIFESWSAQTVAGREIYFGCVILRFSRKNI